MSGTGGMSGMGGGGAYGGAGITDLRAMIADADPGTLDSVAAKWAAVDLALQRAQDDLLHHTRAATTHWTGSAADAFTTRATELHHALGAGASYASHASSGVSYAADALRTARLDMPPEPASLDGVATAEQAHTTGTAIDALHEQQRRQAVTVMQTLERRYAAAAEMIGNPSGMRFGSDRGVFSATTSSPSLHASQSKDLPHEGARAAKSQQPQITVGNAPNEASRFPSMESNRELPQDGEATLGPMDVNARLASESAGSIVRPPKDSWSLNSEPAPVLQSTISGTHFPSVGSELETEGWNHSGSPDASFPGVVASPQDPQTSERQGYTQRPSGTSGRDSGIPTRKASYRERPGGGAIQASEGIPRRPSTQRNTLQPFEGTWESTAATAGSSALNPPPVDGNDRSSSTLAPPLVPSPRSRHRRTGSRPSYLVEDPGIWSAHVKTNPPVIDR